MTPSTSGSAAGPRPATYRPEIDGLRAIAVVAVILHHSGVPGVGGGYVGVDVFFVISGYLITSMIAGEVRQGRFSLARFYERRVRRILPAFFAMTAASSLAAWLVVPPTDLARYGRSVVATATFHSNLLFWRQEGYFDVAAHAKPMLHTWSLAVEEQFYIVFPLLVIALYRWQRGRVAAWLVGALAASLAACVWVTAGHPKAAFYHMPLRAWELLAGGVLAFELVPVARRRWVREVEAALGLLLLGVAIATFSDATAFPGAHAIVPCAGAALLLHAHGGGAAPTAVGWLLQRGPVVFVGKISYSLYLWHWPLIVFAAYAWIDPPAHHVALVLAATAALSVLSWRYVEQPFRGRAPWITRRRLFAGFAVATAAAVGFGAATMATRGWPGRVAAAVRALDGAAADYNHDRPRCHGNEGRPIRFDDKCVYGAPGVAPAVAIWGDSMAAELAVALGREVGARGRALVYISYSSCPPAQGLTFADRPGCDEHNAEMLARLAASSTITKIVLVAQYKRYTQRLGPRFLDGFAAAADALARAGKQVFIVYPIPTPPGRVPVTLARYAHQGASLDRAHLARAAYDAENRATIAALDRLVQRPGLAAVRLDQRLCDAARCRVVADGRVLYFDDRHLSVTGATFVMPAFAAVFE